MWFKAGWLSGVGVLAVVDGALLGGVAAIITSLGTIILGVLAYRKGSRAGGDTADAWKALADERAKRLALYEAIDDVDP